MKNTNIKAQLGSLILQIALMIACSFLYAVVLQSCWNWFAVPLAPSALIQIPYPLAYGLVLLIDTISVFVTKAKVGDDPETQAQGEHPIQAPILKAVAKVLVVLLMWGFAAIVHAIIG